MRIAIKPALAKKLAAKLRRIDAIATECAKLAEQSDIGMDWPAIDRIMTDAREQVASLTEHQSVTLS